MTSPTGGGKTAMMEDCAAEFLGRGIGVCLFCNRKLLIDQITKGLRGRGIYHGVRAASHDTSPWELFQVCSIQTEHSRVVKRKKWNPVENCGLFIVDEAHLNENPTAQKVYAKYAAMGATKLGFTATPLGLDGCYDQLVIAGTTSELRACGALVNAVHHGCTEPDMRNIRKYALGEDLSENDDRKLVMVPGIHGVVIDWFRRLNPHGLPSIGFAPGVPESVGFAEAFEEAGVPAAHIDGDRIWVRGIERSSTEESRRELLEMSRTGEVRIVWNRFVLREAVDMPWLRHGILATVFGSLQSYLQSGGRLLRSCPPAGKSDVVVQDHGGNWHRHGSLNADRSWRLSDTNRIVANLRYEDIAGGNGCQPREPEPFLCPKCQTVLAVRDQGAGILAVCWKCGHTFSLTRRSRPVIQHDGELVMHEGPLFRPRPVEHRPDTAEIWESVYWRCRRSKTPKTFTQARGLFFHENGYYPPNDLPMMPKTAYDWYLPIKNVKDLIPKQT